MELIFTIRSVYGNDLIYPANEPAKQFTQLVQRKTVDNWHLEIAKSLNLEVKINSNLPPI